MALLWIVYANVTRDGWTSYEDHQRFMWRAHQVSLHAGIRDSSALYRAEPSQTEQKFIALAVRNVDQSAKARLPTKPPVLGSWIDRNYPNQYPATPRDLAHARDNSVQRVFGKNGPLEFIAPERVPTRNVGLESTRWG